MDHQQRNALKIDAQKSYDHWFGAQELLHQLTEQKQLSPLQIQAAEAVVEKFKNAAGRTWSAYMASFEDYGLVAEVQVVAAAVEVPLVQQKPSTSERFAQRRLELAPYRQWQ